MQARFGCNVELPPSRLVCANGRGSSLYIRGTYISCHMNHVFICPHALPHPQVLFVLDRHGVALGRTWIMWELWQVSERCELGEQCGKNEPTASGCGTKRPASALFTGA